MTAHNQQPAPQTRRMGADTPCQTIQPLNASQQPTLQPELYQEGDLEKFFGIDPDFTGNMSTSEYLDYVRTGRKPAE